MITFKQLKTSDTNIRFGKLYLDENEYYDIPSFAPVPRREYETVAMMDLKARGVTFPIIIAPLSKRKEVRSLIASSVISDDGRIIGSINDKSKTLTIPDTESEVFSFNVPAREEYSVDKSIPKSVKEILLKTALSDNKDDHTIEYGEAWDIFKKDFSLSVLRAYEEKLQSELGSPIFFVPTPLIRTGIKNVERAINYGIEMMLTTEKQSFKGIGLNLLIHSEIFGQSDNSEASRTKLIKMISKLGKQDDARITSFPFISFKIYDPSNYLVLSSQASVFRRNLSDTIVSLMEEVRSMNGLLIAHNFGRWGLGAIDSGADITGFRCDAQVFKVDRFYRRQGEVKADNLPVPPFDPEKFSDGNLREFKRSWLKNDTFPHPPHVEPENWWDKSPDTQYRYRARTIVDSHMEFGKETRDSINSNIPVSDAISSRVGRMKEQDPMFDLCPSLRRG